jgi:hypothetical protein
MGKANPTPKLTLPEQIIFTRLSEDDGIILNLSTKNYYSLNGTACFILESLKKGSTYDKLASSLAKRYRVKSGIATKDLDQTLNYLRMEKIIS